MSQDRRSFLKLLGLGVGAAIAAPVLTTPVSGESFARRAPTALGGKMSKIYAEHIDDENPSMSDLSFHEHSTNNPHYVTKAYLGLGPVKQVKKC